MFIWTMLFTALAVVGTVVFITDGGAAWGGIVAGGVMGAIGWIVVAPMLIHRNKIIIKNDIIFAHKMQKKILGVILQMWTDPIANAYLPKFAWHSAGRIVRFSWIKRWQKIDLSKVVQVREMGVVFETRSLGVTHNVQNLRDVEIEFMMLRNIDGSIYVLNLTEFRESHCREIIEYIEARVNQNSHLLDEAKSVSIPKPILKQTRRQKKEKVRKMNKEKEMQVKIEESRQAGLSSLILTDAGPNQKITARIIQRATGKDIDEIEKMISKLPCLVLCGVSRNEAKFLADDLTASHVRVSVKIR